MRVVFLGTPDFALPSLRALVNSRFEVCAVVTQPDRPAGRGLNTQPPPVKIFAQESRIPFYQPAKIRSEENRPLFESFRCDFLVAVAYGQILPRWLLDLPRLAPVNVHASLLPKYRGASPVARALLNGETLTGVTTMLMEETLDTGPVLLQKEVPVELAMTCGQLESLLAEVGADLLVRTLEGLNSGSLRPRPQDHSRATLAPKVTKEMAVLRWDQTALKIHNQIRALNPWPLARTEFKGQTVQLFQSLPASVVESQTHRPGTLVGLTQGGILVQCGENTVLEVLQLQVAGRKRVTGRQFASGARASPGESLFPFTTSE